jgi:signal transduction histidine kinase
VGADGRARYRGAVPDSTPPPRHVGVPRPADLVGPATPDRRPGARGPVPGDRGTAPRDAGWAVLVAAAWFGTLAVLVAGDYWHPAWGTSSLIAGAALVAAVAGRRAAPRTTAWGVLVGYPLLYRTGLQSELHLAPVLLAAFAGARSGALAAPVAGGLTTAAVLALLVEGGWALNHGFELARLGLWVRIDPSYAIALVGLGLAAVALGAVVHRLERTSAALADRNAELERLQPVLAQRAVLAERTRIAREVHDVVAHHVAGIVVRAQAATRVSPRRPEAPLDATRWIAEAGREALTAMRAAVGTLRGDPAPAGLDEVARAADRLRAAGVAVDLELPSHPLPAPVAAAGARIVQEALTNVLLHSAATRVAVRVRREGGLVQAVVADPGPARTGTAGGGNGLAHVRERAAAVGGVAEAGPDGSGGWRVRAELPVAPGSPDGAAGEVP